MKTILLGAFCSGIILAGTLQAADHSTIQDFFLPQCRNAEVKSKPLEPEKRAYLKKFGIDDRTLDIFGGLYTDGYADNTRWGDIQPDVFDGPMPQFDTTGMAKLSKLPPPGVHPRLFFTDADRPAHRARIETTKAGAAIKKLFAACEGRLFGTAGSTAGDVMHRKMWEAYSSGHLPDPSVFPPNTNPFHKTINAGDLALEAYRCWLYDDAAQAKKVATAMETAVRASLAELKPGQLPGSAEGGAVKCYVGYNLDYIYDILYNYLTPAQRDLFRQTLVSASFSSGNYGIFQSPLNTASNWATFGYRIYGWLGLEGDPGFNPLQYAGYVLGMKKYYTSGWFKAGPCFEAFGKNQIGGDIAYGMALRGDYVIAHPHILATLRDYLPHAIVPWGNAYAAYDRWGGVKDLNQNDLLPIKALFPNDKKIDWLYRNTVHEDYSWADKGLPTEGYLNSALYAAIWACDYDPNNNDPAQLMGTESFMDPQRGLMITRSDWGKNALYLHMHSRGFSGGHVFADRSSIMLAGQGRVWIPNGDLSYRTRENSVVSVDEREISNYNPARLADYERTPMATFSTADLLDAWNYTYTRLDPWGTISQKETDLDLFHPKDTDQARESWSSGYAQITPFQFRVPDGWQKVTQCFNDMTYSKDPSGRRFTISQWAKPHWLEPDGITSLIRKREEVQFSKAFRTAGMVRPAAGSKAGAYALVIDDFQATDGKFHTYDWLARVAPDLELVNISAYDATDGKRANRLPEGHIAGTELVLGSVDDIERRYNGSRLIRTLRPGSKALLVRVLQMNAEPIKKAGEFDLRHPQGPANGPASLTASADLSARTLQVRTVTDQPAAFRVLLFPGINADQFNRLKSEPVTTWNADRTQLTVKFPDQTDVISFKMAERAPTRFTINRGNNETFTYLEHP